MTLELAAELLGAFLLGAAVTVGAAVWMLGWLSHHPDVLLRAVVKVSTRKAPPVVVEVGDQQPPVGP